jgi:hypothetical protein
MPITREEMYLDKAIDRYSPDVAATARAGLKKLRARFPGARQLVYERARFVWTRVRLSSTIHTSEV